MKNKSQSTVEYAVLIAVIVAAMVGMNLYVRRSVQANLKSTEDQINVLDWEFKVIPTISPPKPPPCFAKGTKITLADGSVKPIDEIKVGDQVLGYNGKGTEAGEITKTFSHPKSKGYLLIVAEDKREIKATGNHLIFRGKGYKAARWLKPGDSIFVLKDNALKPVKIKSVEVKDEVINLYNLEVARLHSFFAEGALFHNKPPKCAQEGMDCTDLECCEGLWCDGTTCQKN